MNAPNQPEPGPGDPLDPATPDLSEDHRENWFRRAPVPMHSMGPDGLLRAVNDEWVAFTGYSRAHALGQSFGAFLEPESAILYRQQAVPEMVGTVPGGGTRSVEYRLRRAHAGPADIVLTARAVRDPADGRFLHSLSVLIDITARNRAEAALRQAQKLDALGSLTGGVAHDFNNLLMAILTSLAMLQKRLPPGDERAAQLLQTATQGAERGAALTRRLLAFARQQDLAPCAVSPSETITGVTEMLARSLGPAIRLEHRVAGGAWLLSADPNQLDLALINLAVNARDAMPEGGVVTLAARNEAVSGTSSAFFADRPAPTLAAGDYVVIGVSDHGVGMTPDILARATEPFFTTKGLGKGTGMGLAMVHGFAVQSGGAFRLASTPGIGTTAELWLPRAPDQPAAAPAAPTGAPAAAIAGAPLRVLLVDDDPLVRMGTAAMLEDLGHVVVAEAASGAEALEALGIAGGIDLLLTDQAMPGMSGLALAQAVGERWPGVSILIASGYAEAAEGDARWPRLPKPYAMDELAAALTAVRRAAG